MKKQKQNEAGFTLIEILITVGILAFVTGAITNIMMASTRTYQNSNNRSQNLLTINRTLTRLTAELRYAKTMTDPAPSQTTTQANFLNTDGQTTNIYLGTGTDANTIILKENNVTTRFGRGLVQNLTFTRNGLNPKKISLSITLKGKTQYGDPDLTMDSSVIMPNL